MGTFFEEVGTSFKLLSYWVFRRVFAEILAQISRQSVQHLLLGQPYNVRISGIEIEELVLDSSEGAFVEEEG
jgi:hypothetical protein